LNESVKKQSEIENFSKVALEHTGIEQRVMYEKMK